MHISIYLPFVKKKSPFIDSFKLIYRILNQNKMPLKDVKLGENVKIPYDNLVNLYGCEIGPNCFIGPFVEIQKNVKIGEKSRIQSHSFICEGVEIGSNTFIGHGVMFTNDLFDSDNIENFILRKTIIGDNVRMGSNATILPVKIGDGAIIGAGCVVTKDVPAGVTVVGNPSRILEKA